MRKCRPVLLSVAAILLATPDAAKAAQLTIADLDLPDLSCLRSDICHPSGSITTVAAIPLPGLVDPGTALVRTRTLSLPSIPLLPGLLEGKTPYLYRVDLKAAHGAIECLGGLVVNFGPSIKVPHRLTSLSDVTDVLLVGEGGDIGVKSAERDGDVITFEFKKLLCGGDRTAYFGLTSNRSPAAKTGGVFAMGDPPFYEVSIRAPAH